MRSNAVRAGHTHRGNQNRTTSKAAGQVASETSSAAPRRKGEKRVLFYGLDSCAREAILQMDKGTRYAEKGKDGPITHHLSDSKAYRGYLRPWDYFDRMKAEYGNTEFSALGQIGYEQFYALYRADDYAEEAALLQQVECEIAA